MAKVARISLLTGCTIGLCTPQAGYAQRAESTSDAQIIERDTCPITPTSALASERRRTAEFLGPVIGAIVASIAGEVVKAGVNAAGNALENASKEHGFVAEGSAAMRFGVIDQSDNLAEQARFRPTEKCLVFYVPSGSGDIGTMFTDPSLSKGGGTQFEWLDADGRIAITSSFSTLGMKTLPSVYIEGVVLPGREGFIFRPSLVWYRSALKGAPKSASAAELHVTFATPAFDAAKPGIGSAFAGAQIKLPKLSPGTLLKWDQLQSARSVWLPTRPTAGAVETKVQAINTAMALVGTRKEELTKATRTLAAAQRAQQRKPGPEATEAVTVAQELRTEADTAMKAAIKAVPAPQSSPAGATNVQMRFVVIRDENKFGMAIATALKGQTEPVGKAVTDAIKPKDDWAATDSAYLTAMVGVEQKQKLLDDAVASANSAGIISASQELRLAKAKANEAAVTSKKPLPYPGLLSDLKITD